MGGILSAESFQGWMSEMAVILIPDGLLALVQPLVNVSFPHSVFLSVRRRDKQVILKLKESGVWQGPHSVSAHNMVS